MCAFGDVPYLLCGDFNVTLSKSEVLRAAVSEGDIIDLSVAYAANPDEPENTFNQAASLEPWMAGKCISRIGGVFANATAAAAVVGVRYRWDLTAIDHAPIELEMDTTAFQSDTNAPLRPAARHATAMKDLDDEQVCQYVEDAMKNHRARRKHCITRATD